MSALTPDLRILIVDDMSSMRFFVKKSLQKLGFNNVIEAQDGEEGYNQLKAAFTEGKPVGLVLCDWNMPKVTGLEMLAKVRADKDVSTVPYIMITAENEVKNVTAAIKAGVNNYLVKPFTPDSLKEKLDITFKKLSKS